ncbi:hypothetical protein FACS189413_17590 [Bacteroidia bacterium]|nr:hypothetical protein FACS189413_17590 [Bacteroidia bacterium]
MLSGKNLLSIIHDEKANIKLEVSGEDLLEFSNDLTNSDKDDFLSSSGMTKADMS